MKKSFTKYAEQEVRSIHRLSKRLNCSLGKDHARVLLDMIKEHADEVRELHDQGDAHYLVEAGDLLVLCLELIKEAKASPNAVLQKCYPRFHKKLLSLMLEK
ncbi:MAG: hypothetical protein WCO69_05190 [Candidatus Omnitrophota bacterium]